MTRRDVLLAGAAVAGSSASLARATDPASQPADASPLPSQLKISMAGYSFRSFLDRPSKPGKMSLLDFVDLGVKWGLDGVEPTSYYFLRDDDEFIFALKRHAFLSGLEISGTPVRNDFCKKPGPDLDKEIAHVRKWVDHCVKLGSPVIRIFAGKKARTGQRERHFANATAAMKEAGAYAHSKGVFLAIENHGYLTETADDLLRILETVDSPALGINLDTGNFRSNPYGNIAKAAPHANACQVKVKVRDNEGKKQPADFARIFQILRKANYRGYVTLEYEEAEPHARMPAYIRRLQDLARKS
jgi:sugar phosphate isomerase/epimerase